LRVAANTAMARDPTELPRVPYQPRDWKAARTDRAGRTDQKKEPSVIGQGVLPVLSRHGTDARATPCANSAGQCPPADVGRIRWRTSPCRLDRRHGWWKHGPTFGPCRIVARTVVVPTDFPPHAETEEISVFSAQSPATPQPFTSVDRAIPGLLQDRIPLPPGRSRREPLLCPVPGRRSPC